jgi:hypothetical protein
LAVASGSSRSNRENNVDKRKCVEIQQYNPYSNTPYINLSGPVNNVAYFKLRIFLTILRVMGDMSNACPNLSSGI